jgi:hypothetical protein
LRLERRRDAMSIIERWELLEPLWKRLKKLT